ncbi:MAG: proton-conducting transporter membrane subunit [Pseudohongiellaceae bacterium]|jgi:NAD(P)H-quinone oxidoreductase subunit 5
MLVLTRDLIITGIFLLAAVLPAALLAGRRRLATVLQLARLASSAMLLVALLAVATTAVTGADPLAAMASRWPPLALRLDLLGTTMLLMISLVGFVVTEFSRRYLEGDPRHGAFVGHLCLTLACACTLAVAGTLGLFWLAWVGTSLSLHRLLLFYPQRPLARRAATQEFCIARVGDVALLGAFLLLARAAGSDDLATIAGLARRGALAATDSGVALAAWLIVLAAVLKSAQFPLHGWLTEVMETPTPVSALLHAGIVNGGGFLVLRLADVLITASAPLHALALIGAVTALVGSVIMLTQSTIKESLAWSTISQMGFMLLQCGLGVFPLAWLHILTHSLYKAHAFLSAGSVVELAKDEWLPDLRLRPRLPSLLIDMAVALAVYLLAGWLLGVLPDEHAAALVLGSSTVLGLTLFLSQSRQQRLLPPLFARTLTLVAAAGLFCFALQAAALWVMRSTLPLKTAVEPFDLAMLVALLAVFPAITVAQYLLPTWYGTRVGRSLRVHLANGLYMHHLVNRLFGALERTSPQPFTRESSR